MSTHDLIISGGAESIAPWHRTALQSLPPIISLFVFPDNMSQQEKKATGKRDRKDSPTSNLNPPTRHSPRTISPLALHGNKTSSPHSKNKVESPLASPISSPGGNITPTVFSSSQKDASSGDSIISKKSKRSTCPCEGSSEGRDWVLQCSECRQCWHASCANLKGTSSLSQSNIDSILKHWLCPWCYSCPYTRPKSHPACKKEEALIDRTISCSTIEQITKNITKILSQRLPSSLPSQ